MAAAFGPIDRPHHESWRPVSEIIALADLPITARERDVLSWVAGGKTDREISALLGTSPRTVQKHLQHIYQKLGVETRTAAVMRAMELGARRPPAA